MKSEFKSAMEDVLGGKEPAFTTIKWKQKYTNGVKKRTIDYIFYRGEAVRIVSHLALPTDADIDQEKGLPSHKYPSDHVALSVEFIY